MQAARAHVRRDARRQHEGRTDAVVGPQLICGIVGCRNVIDLKQPGWKTLEIIGTGQWRTVCPRCAEEIIALAQERLEVDGAA
jgi:hypothetical protein